LSLRNFSPIEMPKSKKSKIVSLVAYQGDEDDQDSNKSGSETESETSKNSSDFEIEIDSDTNEKRAAIKRDRASTDHSEDNEDKTDEALKKSKGITDEDIELETNDSPALSIKADIELMEENSDSELLNEDLESNESEPLGIYTLEKGFPPGCENIRLPAAPRAPCSQSLQNKIIQVVDRMERFNYSINDDIHRKKSFKNPSIYEKFIDVYGIDEFGSSFPSHVENLKSDGYMFYDELDSIQRAEWARIEKAKKDRTKIEMVSGTKKGTK